MHRLVAVPVQVGEGAGRVRLPELDNMVRDDVPVPVIHSAADGQRPGCALGHHQVLAVERQSDRKVRPDRLRRGDLKNHL
jgi:hypothetical protein